MQIAWVVESHSEAATGFLFNGSVTAVAVFGYQSSCLPRRRIKITAPNKTAIIPAMRRTVVESIKRCLLPSLSVDSHIFSIMGIKSRTRRVITGPIVTTKRDGSTQKNIGKTSLTASLEACSSALCRAIVRR
jgi:hypothetical protein